MVTNAQLLLRASITEGLVFLVVTFVVIMLFVRYFTRRKTAALTLAVAFTFWDFAIISLFICRVLAYLKEIGILVSAIDYAGLGINLGYGFSALSNIFIFVFVAVVFSQSQMFRRTGMLIPIIFGALNGITIGIIFGVTIGTWPTPEYGLFPTLYHLALTFIAFSTLIIFTIRPLRYATLKWERTGFQFIIISGVLGILIYLSFALDFVFGTNMLNLFGHGYTGFFFLAYVFAILMLAFAYLGYVMPVFIRKRLKETEKT